eukprot:TRINITY_DN41560_c0_g1_i1.p1 TRINITY_DN41560_c0_g1~~TRINITY_DN41560_c0_g1_i1.p1  ORF type:complete len:265 (-),score=47.24 TRINITY_DN41560_c0_g1_i1:206-1000(-)
MRAAARLLPQCILVLRCLAWEVYAEQAEQAEQAKEGENYTLAECLIFGQMCQFGVFNGIMAAFFLVWNAMISPVILGPLVRCLVFGLADGCRHFNPMFCIFPHWYIGIIAPCFFGGFLSGSVAVVIPYTINFGRLVHLAMKEKATETATVTTRVKMDVLDVLKEAQSEIKYANHTDDVIEALENMKSLLEEIRLPNGQSVVQRVAWQEDDVVGFDVNKPDMSKMRSDTSTSVTSPKSSASKLTRSLSGHMHFSTGVPNSRQGRL